MNPSPRVGNVLLSINGEPVIHDRGRGPEIVGTRITVYDVLDYHRKGHPPDFIASVLPISPGQASAAVRYIEEHRDEVWAGYKRILDRHAQGNHADVQAYLDLAPQRLRRRLEELRDSRKAAGEGAAGARDSA